VTAAGPLTGRAALITGASQGLGRAIAAAYLRAGASLAICARDRAALEQATVELAELATGEQQIVALACDVARPDDVARVVDAATAALPQLDILVNNAGIAINGLIMRFTDDQWAKTLQVNLTGAFYAIRAASTLLLKAKESGRIVNISSVVGQMGNGGQAAYAASKAGLIGLTMTTARELAPRGVTCNAVAPGYIETDMTAQHLPEAARAKLMEQIPLARIGQADDVANAVAFLAGPEAGYITGQVLRVNGGMLM